MNSSLCSRYCFCDYFVVLEQIFKKFISLWDFYPVREFKCRSKYDITKKEASFPEGLGEGHMEPGTELQYGIIFMTDFWIIWILPWCHCLYFSGGWLRKCIISQALWISCLKSIHLLQLNHICIFLKLATSICSLYNIYLFCLPIKSLQI